MNTEQELPLYSTLMN